MTKLKRLFTIILRLLALGATTSAIIIMVTSHDSTEVLNLKFTVKYSNSPTFKYFVIVEAIASGYTLMVLFISPKSVFSPLVVVLDIVTTLLLTSGISAALAIAEVGKKGNSHAGWFPICDQVPKFCDRVSVSLILGFAAPIVYFVLNLYSLHPVFNPLFAVKP
ncbi:hypothetical protein SLEP1_g52860 [Rubroshorea leprosula]|uniref:CASP-like protein n=1 Tax=Rubroshorea leprosula TaxID=152421 RepID=A0AAV5M7K1_9ROSI|nr:hypothetical protein SLEP1_g52860 [Rubroshorea leprosula]